MKQEGNMKLA